MAAPAAKAVSPTTLSSDSAPTNEDTTTAATMGRHRHPGRRTARKSTTAGRVGGYTASPRRPLQRPRRILHPQQPPVPRRHPEQPRLPLPPRQSDPPAPANVPGPQAPRQPPPAARRLPGRHAGLPRSRQPRQSRRRPPAAGRHQRQHRQRIRLPQRLRPGHPLLCRRPRHLPDNRP